MSELFFSIIIPMYNVEQYIERCLQSIFEQTGDFLPYEIIIVNDGSPDNSLKVAENYCKGKDNIKILSQENKGLGGARNTGIINAKGKYLLFLDSDDWYLPNCLESLSKELNDEDIIEFSVEVKNNVKTLHTLDFENTKTFSGIDYFLTQKTINSACNKLYKRSFITENNFLFMEKIYGEDIQFNSRVFYLTKSIKSINQHLIIFYQSPGSITRSRNLEAKLKYLKDLENVIISVNEFKEEHSLGELEDEKYFYERITSLTVNSLLFGLKNKLPSSKIQSFISNLKNSDSYDLSHRIKERNAYRKIFNQPIVLNFILLLNKLRP